MLLKWLVVPKPREKKVWLPKFKKFQSESLKCIFSIVKLKMKWKTNNIYFKSPDPSGLKKIVSVGQFRPEKDHASQIRAMFALRQIISEDKWEKVTCIFALIGIFESSNLIILVLNFRGFLEDKRPVINRGHRNWAFPIEKIKSFFVRFLVRKIL